MSRDISRVFVFYQILISIGVLILVLLSYSIDYLPLLDVYPYVFLIFMMFLLIWNNFSGIYFSSTYSIFLVTFSLFMGGRLIAGVLQPSLNIYDMDFFVTYTLTPQAALVLMTYMMAGVIFIDLGYKISLLSNYHFPILKIKHLYAEKLAVVALLLSPIWVIKLLLNVKEALAGGYLASKTWQTASYTFPLSSLAETIFALSFGYSMVCNFKKTYFLILFLFMVISSTLIGARGPILSALCLYIWWIGKNGTKKVNIGLILILLFSMIFAVSLFNQLYSFRSTGQSLSPDFIIKFFYSQGISLMVFDVSMKIDNYPILAYFQSIFPGASAVASLFTDVDYAMTGFQHYLAKTLDPKLFMQGYGLDWTLLSDFYVFGGENIIGFSICALLFGFFLSTLQNSSKCEFWYVFLFSVMTRLVFLPRSSLSIIFPFLFYFMFLYWLLPRLKVLMRFN